MTETALKTKKKPCFVAGMRSPRATPRRLTPTTPQPADAPDACTPEQQFSEEPYHPAGESCTEARLSVREAAASALFRAWDTNQNGTLSHGEIKKNLKKDVNLQHIVSAEDFHWRGVWEVYDAEDNGTLEESEFVRFYCEVLVPEAPGNAAMTTAPLPNEVTESRRSEKALGYAQDPETHPATSMFDSWDRNRDGKLSHGEVKKAMKTEPRFHQVVSLQEFHWAGFFERYDTNADGTISRDEFVTLFSDLEIKAEALRKAPRPPTEPPLLLPPVSPPPATTRTLPGSPRGRQEEERTARAADDARRQADYEARLTKETESKKQIRLEQTAAKLIEDGIRQEEREREETRRHADEARRRKQAKSEQERRVCDEAGIEERQQQRATEHAAKQKAKAQAQSEGDVAPLQRKDRTEGDDKVEREGGERLERAAEGATEDQTAEVRTANPEVSEAPRDEAAAVAELPLAAAEPDGSPSVMFSGRISFDEIDANRDGVIDRYEFEAFLRSRSRSPPMYRERDDAERGGEVPRGGEKEALGDTEVDTEKASLATTERFEQERGALEAARVAEVARPSPAHARIRSPSKERSEGISEIRVRREWRCGSKEKVSWRTKGFAKSVTITLFTAMRGLVDILACRIENVDQAEVRVPSGLPPGSYLVMVKSAAASDIRAWSKEIVLEGGLHGENRHVTSTSLAQHASLAEHASAHISVELPELAWHSGGVQRVEWTTPGYSGHIETLCVALYTARGVFRHYMEYDVPASTGSCEVRVPLGLPPGSYRVEVQASDNHAICGFSRELSLDGSEDHLGISHVMPEDEEWLAGSCRAVTWRTIGEVTKVSLNLCTIKGRFVTFLNHAVDNTGECLVTVPTGVPEGRYTVAVEACGPNDALALSEAAVCLRYP